MNSIFSKNLKDLRRIHNYSQQEIADLLGIGRPRYASYEERRCEPPYSILVSICECYGITDLYSLLTTNIGDRASLIQVKENKAVLLLEQIKQMVNKV